MKQNLLNTIIAALICCTIANAQTPVLWGLSAYGDERNLFDKFGALFKINGDGTGFQKCVEFSPDIQGSTPTGTLIQASDGKLYGATTGIPMNDATIFSFDPVTRVYTSLHLFTYNEGVPRGGVIQGADGKLYGLAVRSSVGILYCYDIAAKQFSILSEELKGIGFYSRSGLVQAPNNIIYGTSSFGGTYSKGSIFSFDIGSKTLSVLHSFKDTTGAIPQAGLIYTGGRLIGTAEQGGSMGYGSIFAMDIATGNVSVLHSMDSVNGASPYTAPVVAANGKLYGTTVKGGANKYGVIYSLDTTTLIYTSLFNFDATTGRNPLGSVAFATNDILYGGLQGGPTNFGTLYSFNITNNTFSKKFDFNGLNGYLPTGKLLHASDGLLYGTTEVGGDGYYVGVLFSYNPQTDVYQKCFNFNQQGKGGYPNGTLTVDDENHLLYGIATIGGLHNYGTIFNYEPATSAFHKLHDFNDTTGSYPQQTSLLKGSNGKYYGLTQGGGANQAGVLFSFDPTTLKYKNLYDFDDEHGAYPNGSLIQTPDGKLFGMTQRGGINDMGVIFKCDTNGLLDVVFDFDSIHGSYPYGSLLMVNNNLYGMTVAGGILNDGVIFKLQWQTGTYTQVHNFNIREGSRPNGDLIQAKNGYLYGITSNGGTAGAGVIFIFDPEYDDYTMLYELDFFKAASSYGSLMEASDGNLYGMSYLGGMMDNGADGIVFKFNPGFSTYSTILEMNYSAYSPFGNLVEMGKPDGIEQVAAGTLSLYPNPAASYTTITNNGNLNGGRIQLEDVNGKVLLTDRIGVGDYVLPLQQFSAGAYFVTVQTSSHSFARLLMHQ